MADKSESNADYPAVRTLNVLVLVTVLDRNDNSPDFLQARAFSDQFFLYNS